MYPKLLQLQPFFSHICLVPVFSSPFLLFLPAFFLNKFLVQQPYLLPRPRNIESPHVFNVGDEFQPWVYTVQGTFGFHCECGNETDSTRILNQAMFYPPWQLKPPKYQRFGRWISPFRGPQKRPVFRGKLAVSFREGNQDDVQIKTQELHQGWFNVPKVEVGKGEASLAHVREKILWLLQPKIK